MTGCDQTSSSSRSEIHNKLLDLLHGYVELNTERIALCFPVLYLKRHYTREFGCVVSDEPKDGGDRVQYPKQTNFDSHFHDCDEYWILFEGRGEVFSEGCRYAVGPGDCVATGMGHHHDMPIVDETIHAVYFETTMEGQKRRGHLWDHKHGAAQPQQDRV